MVRPRTSKANGAAGAGGAPAAAASSSAATAPATTPTASEDDDRLCAELEANLRREAQRTAAALSSPELLQADDLDGFEQLQADEATKRSLLPAVAEVGWREGRGGAQTNNNA